MPATFLAAVLTTLTLPWPVAGTHQDYVWDGRMAATYAPAPYVWDGRLAGSLAAATPENGPQAASAPAPDYLWDGRLAG